MFNTAENPNAKADIGLIVAYPFQFYVFKNIYRHLPNAEFIVDLGVHFPHKPEARIAEDILALLKKHGVYYRVIHHEDYFFRTYLEKFFSQYAVLSSLWWKGCITLECNAEKKKVSVNYGGGKDLSLFRPWGRLWDLNLAMGRRDHELLKFYTHSVITGNEKFDDWFNNEFDEEFLSDLRRRLDPKKKTVLYLPTHGDLSSFESIIPRGEWMTKEFNFIAKVHYHTVRSEPERMELLKSAEHIIGFNDDTDLLPLLKVADVVVSDNSSAIFDAILADKPLVVADFWTAEFLDGKYRKINIEKYWNQTPLTYSGSIEQRIKKEGAVLTINHPEYAYGTIKKALLDNNRFKAARERIRKEVFEYNDGKCGARSAQAILELKEKNPDAKPILFHVFNAFEMEIEARAQKTQIEVINKPMRFLWTLILSAAAKKIIRIADNWGKIFFPR